MEEYEMERKEMWMPPMYSKGLVYTCELTPEADAKVPDEVLELFFGACEQSDNQAVSLEKCYRRYYQLNDDHRKELVSYCMELDFWHEDLDFLLFEMDTSVRYFHQDRLDLKRLTIIYHTDNFYFRIHAYREKVFHLISVFLGLGIPDRYPQFNDKVFEELGSRGLDELKRLLSDLSGDPKLSNDPIWSEALGRRNPFAHRLAKRDWGVLKSEERIYDYIYARSDPDKVDKLTDLDRYHMIKLEEFGCICERLAKFRDGLVAALKASCP